MLFDHLCDPFLVVFTVSLAVFPPDRFSDPSSSDSIFSIAAYLTTFLSGDLLAPMEGKRHRSSPTACLIRSRFHVTENTLQCVTRSQG